MQRHDASDRYPEEPPPMPEYSISPELRKLVLMFIGALFINFLIAGALAIGMRVLQTDVSLMPVNSIPRNVLFYALLTAHGQVMFFGVASVGTMYFGYYATSKWARKPLSGMKWAKASFWIMEAAIVLIFLSALFGFGAGWYNLMPLTFLPGTPSMTWSTVTATVFLTADVLVGISLTIFCLVVMVTLLKGKLPTGTQRLEEYYEKEEAERKTHENKQDPGYRDHVKIEDLPAAVRWTALLGISAWFTKKWRSSTPTVPIVLVAAFVTALVQIVGNPGLFLQLGQGFMAIQNPAVASNWLLTKDAWWFFAHPIVYFPLLIFLGAAYAFLPRYGKAPISYTKWNYRPWPFYFTFSVLVFAHHVFMDMPNPVWIQMVSQTASLGIVFPSGLTIATILILVWKSKIAWNVTSRFLIAGIAGWAFGGFLGAEMGMWGTDVYLHNTMALPGHIHLIVLLGPVIMSLGVIYAIFPDLTKKHLNKTLGEIHFWMTLLGGYGFAMLFTVIGTEGAIRREANMPATFDWAMPWLLFFALTIGIAQFILVYNVVRTLRRNPTKEEEAEYDKIHEKPRKDTATGAAAA